MTIKANILRSEQVQKLTRHGLVFVLVIWLAWMLADTLWLLVSGPGEQLVLDRDMVLLQNSGQDMASIGPSNDQVASWQLFGPLEQQQVQQQEAPETRLRLELLGVFQNSNADIASAIIAEQGKDGELYRPGEKVPGNATLAEVYTDHVILVRMGQREALRIKELMLGGDVQQVGGRATSEPSAQTFRRQELSPAQQDEDPSNAADADLSQQRSMIITRMGLAPAESGGYAVGANAPDQLLNVVGLRAGDILLSVNGYELGNEEADMAALQDFRSSGAASIVVQRGEQRFTVNYPP